MPRALVLVRWIVWSCVLGLGLLPAQGWVDVSNPANTPGGSDGAAMVYDEARGYCLLIRGSSTWKYDANGWSQVSSANPATVSTLGGQVFIQKAVYDSTRQKVVVAFACRGPSGTPYSAYVDIRFAEWDGIDWAAMPAITNVASVCFLSACPAFPFNFDMAFDRGRGEIVVHLDGYSAQTYTLAAGQWSLRSPLVAPPTSWTNAKRMFFEEHSSRICMIVQQPPSYWEWNGNTGNWAQRFPSWFGSPMTSGSFGSIAYVASVQQAIGLGVEAPYSTRTLRYRNGDIQSTSYTAQPSVRYGYAIAYDRVRDCVVLHGGSGFADTWEWSLGPAATYSVFGSGCIGTRGIPALTTNGLVPVGGQSMVVQVNNLPFTAPTFMFLGFSDTTYAGLSLPFDLNVLGAPGCNLRVSGDQLSGVTNVLGVGLWQFPIPNLPGTVFYNQAIVFDPLANPLGLTLSNGGRGVIGN